MKIGIFSDIHEYPRNIELALSYFKSEKIDLLIGAGDLSNNRNSLDYVLWNLKRAGMASILFPGSHEKVYDWQNALQDLPSFIIDGVRQRKFSLEGFDLVLLPGSEFVSGGDFLLSDEPNSHFDGSKYKFSVNDLDSLVTDKNKTIIACHNPPKFKNIGAVDYAFYGSKSNYFSPGYDALYQNLILDPEEQFSIKRENCGYLPFMEKIIALFPDSTEKVISAHFHESTHRAINRKEDNLSSEEWQSNIYHCASNLDFNRVAIWETRINNGLLEIKYHNQHLVI